MPETQKVSGKCRLYKENTDNSYKMLTGAFLIDTTYGALFTAKKNAQISIKFYLKFGTG